MLLTSGCPIALFFSFQASLKGGGVPPKKRNQRKKKNVCFLTPTPSDPQETSLDIPESTDPLDYSPSVLSDPIKQSHVSSLSGLPGQLRSVNPAAVRSFQPIRFARSVSTSISKGFDDGICFMYIYIGVFFSKMFHRFILPMDRPLHDTQQEKIR